ncbi:MAG: hypothetical protein V4515_14550 [Chloroflexota bacterium]
MQPNYQYPQQPGQYQQAPPPPVMPTVIEPTSGGGGEISPAPRHLVGYAVMCLPTSIDENAAPVGGKPTDPPRPKATTDVIVVGVGPDGNPLPPIEYGDNQGQIAADRRPNVLRLDAFPAEFRGVWWSNSEIVKTLRAVLQANGGQPGAVTMGRMRFGDQGNRPPMLEVMADNDPARAALIEAWQLRAQNRDALRRSVGNGIVEINGGPPVKAPAQQAAPGSAYTGYAQGAPAQGYQQPAQQWGGPPAPPQPGQYPQQPGQQVQYAPPPQPGQYPQQPGAMPPAAVAAGWSPEQWNNAPPAVKAAFGG